MEPSGFLRGLRNLPRAIVAVALLIGLGGLTVVLQNEANYQSAQEMQAEGLSNILAASVTAAVDFGDFTAAQEAVKAYSVDRRIRWIGVYDRSGHVLASLGRKGISAPARASAAGERPSGALRASSAIVQAGQHIGTVMIEIDREAWSRKLSRYVLLGGLLLLTALVVLVLGVTQAQLRLVNFELSARAEALAQANVLLEDQMEQRARAEEQLRQSQKMQALGQLTGGIAHDFNNLLTVIEGSADILTRPDIQENRRVRFATAIVQAAQNASALTSQLLAFARRQPLKPEWINVNELIRSMRDLLDRTLGERIEIETRLCAEDCPVEVDRAQLQSAILNIASNARDAMHAGGRLTIATAQSAGESGPLVELSLTDTGPGMDAPTQARVFEPFFTTKAAGRGTGLGLSQVYGFATQSGGEVQVESDLEKGTTVTMRLPCSLAQRAATETRAELPNTLSSVRILVVDDNEQVGAFAEALLADQGHQVVRANSAEAALDIIREREFDLVFSDVVMPGMGGLRLSETLARERPDLPMILATGYSEELAVSRNEGRPVILKPYRLTTLIEAMAKVLPAKPA